MATNTNLSEEIAKQLIMKKEVLCPNCGKVILTPRYKHKKQNVEYTCTECGEVYHPCKAIGKKR